jgi:ATP-dependent DNA ligase
MKAAPTSPNCRLTSPEATRTGCCIWLDGKDLRKTPQIERKAMLQGLFNTYQLERPVLYSEHVQGHGQQLCEHAAKLHYGRVGRHP